MKNKLSFTIGSHMYGLNTKDSDVDVLSIYFDYSDYIRPFRKLPLVKETENNNVKLYSLDYFAELIVKGNPNLIEVLHLEPTEAPKSSEEKVISLFLSSAKNLEIHSGIPKAYFGHLKHLQREIQNTAKGPSKKRVSHGVRVVCSLQHLILTGKVLDFRTSEHLPYVKSIKEGRAPLEDGLYIIANSISTFENTNFDSLFPDNSYWKEIVNIFFEGLYT